MFRYRYGFMIVLFFACSSFLFSQIPADKAFSLLQDGNKRFVSGKLSKKNYNDEVKKLKDGQQPYAVILSCSDSRVAPEIVFDESLGKLFIVRIAGNVATPEAIGSVEYAVEHLGAKLIVVMGHSKCGAVSAALSGGEATPNIEKLLHYIEPAVEEAKTKKNDVDLLGSCVSINAKNQRSYLLQNSALLKGKVKAGEVKTLEAVYDLASGQVSFVK